MVVEERGACFLTMSRAGRSQPLRDIPSPDPGLQIPRARCLEWRRPELYIVHMKRVTASEARKNWFRLLDEVAQGAVVCIERGGRRIVLRREEPEAGEAATLPEYDALLRVPEVDLADRWGWSWSEETGALEPEG
jgi:hypothetical protein